MTERIPQVTVNPNIWNGLLKPEFATALMSNLKTVDTNLGTKVENRCLLLDKLVVYFVGENGTYTTLSLIDDKVISIYGDCKSLFVNPSISVEEINNILGVKARESLSEDDTYDTWILQKNPEIALTIHHNKNLEQRGIIISVRHLYDLP